MAKQAWQILNLDEVWLLVSPQNPLKDTKDMAPFADRLRMCELMAEDKMWLKASDFEQRMGTQFTADTIDRLINNMPQNVFFWLMGADNMAQFHHWKRWEDITKKVPLVIFNRDNENDDWLNSPAACTLKKYRVSPDNNKADCPNWRVIDNDTLDISATDIRMADDIGTKKALLHKKVLDYINLKKLYADPKI